MGTRRIAAGGFAVGAFCAALFVGGSVDTRAFAQDRKHHKVCDHACEIHLHQDQAADRYSLQRGAAGKLMILDGATGTVYSIVGDTLRTFDPVGGTVTVGNLTEIDERGLIKPTPRKRTIR